MKRPKFSIIIPTYNRPRSLEACLASLARLDYPREDFEVIVVDDGGREALDKVAAPFKAGMNVTLIRQENTGPAGARNLGAKAAKGAFLAFTDDDCAPDPYWLKELDAALSVDPGAIAGGYTENALSRNAYSAASQLLIDYLYEYFEGAPPGRRFFTTNNVATSKARFNEAGGFDASFTRAAAEDRDFCARARITGAEMVYAPKAVVRHYNRLSFPGFCRQHFNYGAGVYTLRKKQAGQGVATTFEPLSFYLNLIAYPFAKERAKKRGNLRAGKERADRGRPIVLSALLCLSQAANVIGYFTAKLKSLN